MSRGNKVGFFASAAAIALMLVVAPVSAASEPIGAVDNTAPDPVTELSAVADLLTSTATVTWTLSGSDKPNVTATGNNADSHRYSNIIGSNNVTMYIINASINGADAVEVARVPAGTTSYDDPAEAGDSRSYEVIATDGTNNSDVVASNTVTFGDPPILAFEPASPGPLLKDDGSVPTLGRDGAMRFQAIRVSNAPDAGDGFVTLASDIPPGFTVFSSVEPSTSEDDQDVIRLPGDQISVPAGLRVVISIDFVASEVNNVNRTYEAVFTFVTNEVGNEMVVYEAQVTVEGADDAAQLDVLGDRLTFVDVPLGETRTQTLTVQNVGGLDLTADLDLTGDPGFDISLTTVNVSANSSATVDVTFTPAATDGEYSGLVTITSDQDPAAAISFTLAGAEGTVTPDNPVEEPLVEVTLTLSADASAEVFVEGSPENVAFKASARDALASALGIPASRIIITAVALGSTEVTFQVIDPPDGDTDAPSAVEVAATLETLVADEPETLVDALEAETGEELGTVDAVVTEDVVVVIQPIDTEGNAVAGWFTRTGSKVDFDDFFAFADAFGSSLGDPSFGTVFDISGTDLVPDGQVNFDDFFRFADDFGKTVANAATVQAILGL